MWSGRLLFLRCFFAVFVRTLLRGHQRWWDKISTAKGQPAHFARNGIRYDLLW